MDMDASILVVDDTPDTIRLISSILKGSYRVRVAKNGQRGIDLALQTNPGIILLDVEMPEMDGYALVAEIRRIEENSQEPMPILAVTASDFNLTKERAISLGFNGYMLKPFEIDVLEKKLASIVYDTSKTN